MRTNKGNSEVVMKDAAKIAERLRTTQTTLAEMMKKYHVAYATLMNAVFSQMSFEEWLKIRQKILSRSGIKNRFPKGHKPYNKNLKGIHLSPKSEFKKGHLPANHKPVGAIIIRNDHGNRFRYIKISGLMKGVHKWEPYARYLWEQKNGIVPAGYFVGHKDGNTLNDSPDNLHLVNRAEHLEKMKKLNPTWKKKAVKSYQKVVHRRNRKQLSSVRKIVKLLRSPANNTPLYKLIRQHELSEGQFYKFVKQILSADEFKEIMETRKARINCGNAIYKNAREQKIDAESENKVDEFRRQQQSGSVTKYQCCGCGQDYVTVPNICPKCNGLRFESIEIPTEIPAPARHLSKTEAA